jgi:putative membrane protein
VAIADVFSPADHAAIEAAVRDVERRTAGEVVPYAVESSDTYARGLWIAATLGALLAGIAAAALHRVAGGWGDAWAAWIALPPLVGAAAGWTAALGAPALRRGLVSAEVLEERVRQRARAAFLDEEVFRTRERTGVLLFVSLLERRVVVLPDRGIAARVPPAEWEAVVAAVVAGMRRREPGRALADGIARCGAILAAHLPAGPDDRDELPGQLRFGRDRDV